LIDLSDVRDVNDQRIVCGPFFRIENFLNRNRIQRVRTKTVDSLCRENDQLAVA
jgi:hypothetical protein